MSAAADVLTLSEARSGPAGRRGLRVGLLNLMPDKPRTLAQFTRLLDGRSGGEPVRLLPCLPGSYQPRDGERPASHRPWRELAEAGLDGLIVTGAPFDRIAYDSVSYWPELLEIFEWSERHLASTLFVCWGAMAALHHFCGLQRWQVEPKLSGLYTQEVIAPGAPLLHGLGPRYRVPVSRHALLDPVDVAGTEGLQLLAGSRSTGASLIQRGLGRQVFLLDHLEYGALALQDEYLRDRALDPLTPLPRDYFPDDDAKRPPIFDWQPPALRFFANWTALLRMGGERRLAG